MRSGAPHGLVSVAVGVAAAMLPGCSRLTSDVPAATSTPRPLVGGVLPLGTPEPPGTAPPMPADLAPTATALVATLTAIAVSAGPAGTPPAPAAPPPDPSTAASAVPPAAPVPLEACPIVKSADVYALAPAPEAPEDVRVAWSGQTTVALDAEVVEHNAELGIYKLAAREPAADHPFLLLHTGGTLPIEIGKRYRFTAHNDVAGQPPAGAGLRIDDEAGPVFLGISTRETDGADRRLMGGDRAGFAIRQTETLCLPGAVDPCGYELRAAPVEVRHGDAAVTLMAGATGALAADPPYVVAVTASHYRRWIGSAPCPDPTDWVLAYRITRGAPSPVTPESQVAP